MACDSQGDLDPHTILIDRRLNRQIPRVVLTVLGVLDTVAVDGLSEIALAVKQTDGDEICIFIARRFAVVPGQHTQAARINRETLVKAILGTEIGDRGIRGGSRLLSHVRVECLQRHAVAGEISRVDRCLIQRRL